MKNITHLIFSGNALNSLNLLGVLRYIYFNKLDENIKNVIGVSMGSLFCLAFALKIPFDELENIIKETIKDFDNTHIKKSDIKNIFIKNGIDTTLNYMKKFKEYIKNKYNEDDMTFMELSKKTGINLYVCSLNLNKCESFIFNINDTPNVSIFDAVASSMTLPFLSTPILIDGYYYIDGAFLNNFPIDVFKDVPNENILGVTYLIEKYNKDNIPKNSEISFYSFVIQIINIFLKIFDNACIKNRLPNYNNVLIFKESPLSSPLPIEITKEYIIKKINEEEVDLMIFQGYKEMHKFMELQQQ
jgi:predicted acylesterase/phospholipase RssA